MDARPVPGSRRGHRQGDDAAGTPRGLEAVPRPALPAHLLLGGGAAEAPVGRRREAGRGPPARSSRNALHRLARPRTQSRHRPGRGAGVPRRRRPAAADDAHAAAVRSPRPQSGDGGRRAPAADRRPLPDEQVQVRRRAAEGRADAGRPPGVRGCPRRDAAGRGPGPGGRGVPALPESTGARR